MVLRKIENKHGAKRDEREVCWDNGLAHGVVHNFDGSFSLMKMLCCFLCMSACAVQPQTVATNLMYIMFLARGAVVVDGLRLKGGQQGCFRAQCR